MGVALQVYHSSFVSEEGITKACGCPLLPLKSHIRGPAPASDPGSPELFIFLIYQIILQSSKPDDLCCHLMCSYRHR